MQAPVEITLLLKKATDLDQQSLDVLEDKKKLSDKQIEILVDKIKEQYDHCRQVRYSDDLLSFYFHLVSALYHLSYYYDSPHARNTTKEAAYANLAEDYLKYFFDNYKQHYITFISQPNKNLTAYYKLALLYKIRAYLCIRRKTTVDETIRYFSLAMRMLYHCHLPQQFAVLTQDLRQHLINHLTDLLAHFLNFMAENLNRLNLTDLNTDNIDKCFEVLQSQKLINEFVTMTTLKAHISAFSIYRDIDYSLGSMIDSLIMLDAKCIKNKQYDLSLKILARAQILVTILTTLNYADLKTTTEQANVVAEAAQIIDLRKGYNHYLRACALLKTNLDDNSVTFDVLFKYIKNGACQPIDDILSHFKQAKRVTQRKGYHDINFADVYEGVFKELLATFAARVRHPSDIVIDIYSLRKKMTNFFLHKAKTAYESKQYDVAKNLYYFAIFTLPITVEQPQTSTYVYAQAALIFIHYNVCRCIYHQEIYRQSISQTSTDDIYANVEKLNFYLFILDIWHTILVAPTKLTRSYPGLLSHEPELLAKLEKIGENTNSLYGKSRVDVNALYQSLANLSAEGKRNFCEELETYTHDIKEQLPRMLKKVYDNLLTPKQQQFVLSNGLVIDEPQEEKIAHASVQP